MEEVMGIDSTKLSPAPWYFVTPAGSEIETLVFNDHDEDVPVLEPFAIGNNACDQNSEFIVLARSAFDVMMRRGWGVRETEGRWQAIENRPGSVTGVNSMIVKTDPFTALLAADEWYYENFEKTGDDQ
jgi:hypothetical protein